MWKDMFLFLFMSLFFSNRCMLELNYALFYRAASLSSQASSVDVCSIGWRIIDQTRLSSNTPCTTNCFSNSEILRNNYILLLSDRYNIEIAHLKKKEVKKTILAITQLAALPFLVLLGALLLMKTLGRRILCSLRCYCHVLCVIATI